MSWDKHWENMEKASKGYSLAEKIHWRRYGSLLEGLNLEKTNTLEIGAGAGRLSMQLKKEYCADCTMIDSSEKAFEVFKKMNPGKKGYLVGDVFSHKMNKKYDLVMSDGLIEHFKGEKQKKLLQIHKNASKKYVIVFAPKPSLPYNAMRWAMKATGTWNFGYEKPLTMSELGELCESVGMTVVRRTKGVWQNGVLCTV